MSSLDNSPFKKYDKVSWANRHRRSNKIIGIIVDGYYQEKVSTRREGWRYLIKKEGVEEFSGEETHIEKYSFEIKRC